MSPTIPRWTPSGCKRTSEIRVKHGSDGEQRRATDLDHDVGALLDRHLVRAGWGSRGKRMSAGEGARVCFIAAVQTTFYRFDIACAHASGPRQAPNTRKHSTRPRLFPEPRRPLGRCSFPLPLHIVYSTLFFLSSSPCLSLALSARRSHPGSGSSRDSGASSSPTPTGTPTSRATGNWG